MKLKVLPPTLRKNKRYLTLDIKSEVKHNKDDFVLAIWDSCIRFWGEQETSNFDLWLMKLFYDDESDDFYHYRAVLKCQRGYEEEVRAALALLTRYNNKKINITTIGLSGTIKSAVDKYI
ncbi:Rpp14/Pop5 family protein [Methanobrevibacter sp. UBA46]|uniref:Rpp14/Pop5 family protein n=1 Tax=Methanobrevibacter sp. UBA46 TaxID=1915488 RepID=UPI0039B99DF1